MSPCQYPVRSAALEKPNMDRSSRDRIVIASNILTAKKWAAAERERQHRRGGAQAHALLLFSLYFILPGGVSALI